MLPTNPLLNATAPAGPHLPTATLRQYAAGTLAPAARHRVEAHTLACPRCADILDGLLQTPAATTDQALAQLQQRLRRRVQQTESARLVAGRLRLGPRWVVPQLAAAATLLFGLVAGGWWTWQQRHPDLVAVAPAPATVPTTATEAPVAVAPAAPAPPAASLSTRPAALATAAATRRLASAGHTQPLAARRLQPVSRVHFPTAAPPPVSAATATSPVDERDTGVVASQPIGQLPAPADSVAMSGRETGNAPAKMRASAAPAAFVRDRAMPAVAPIAPAPVGGYSSWREKIRREAAEFKPEEPAQPVSGSVQLRLFIGADGKIQEVKVLHGLRDDYDAEAQRLVCDGAGWVPGIGGGKRAAQAVDVAIPFQ